MSLPKSDSKPQSTSKPQAESAPQPTSKTQPQLQSQERSKKQEKKKEKKIHTYYVIKDNKIIQGPKKCPRCGSFMAHHEGERNRLACGSCAYTEYLNG